MPQQQSPITVESNFIGGLKTEFTGLNFPENACTATENCVFSLIGDVLRREGIDYETNFSTTNINRTNSAISTFVWTNAGGDGNTKVYVLQVGGTLYFYQLTNATVASPLSTTKLASTVTMSAFIPAGGGSPNAVECQYAMGNGYLFVFHPNLEPFYCTFVNGNITANQITINIRDLLGIVEAGVSDNARPGFLNASHHYNLDNQGWTDNAPWSTSSSTNIGITLSGQQTFTVGAGLNIVNGNPVTLTGTISGTYNSNPVVVTETLQGYVVSYSGTTLNLFITSVSFPLTSFLGAVSSAQAWNIFSNGGTLSTFQTAAGVYPSNADVWWTFKDSTGFYNPGRTLGSTSLSSSPANKGFFILTAFNQDRSTASGVVGLPVVSTVMRPKTGAWFQGRVWYVSPDAVGFTENLYFSQIITDPSQFGKCYQTNDPTNETLFDILPTDGGIVRIPGCGAIYKLFSIQNGLLVFAANGVWFITGSSGLGFTATDYSVVQISGVQSISSTSYIDINGLPLFWNEEGIYEVTPVKQGSGQKTNEQMGLQVLPLTVGTILSFYNNIPLQSKKFARGDYNPLTYVVKWIYRSTNETDVTSRYQFDSVLNFNIANKAFYPYQVAGTPFINGIEYVVGVGGSNNPPSTFKYLVSANNNFTFAEENNTNYLDWQAFDGVGTNYTSFFVTGYRIPGQAMLKFQPQYIRMYARNPVKYTIQGIWDYALSPNTGKYSTVQTITNLSPSYGFSNRRIKIRGHGRALQLKVSSVQGQPFDVIGWAVINDVDEGE